MNARQQEILDNFAIMANRPKQQMQALFEILDWDEVLVLDLIENNPKQIDYLCPVNEIQESHPQVESEGNDVSSNDEYYDEEYNEDEDAQCNNPPEQQNVQKVVQEIPKNPVQNSAQNPIQNPIQSPLNEILPSFPLIKQNSETREQQQQQENSHLQHQLRVQQLKEQQQLKNASLQGFSQTNQNQVKNPYDFKSQNDRGIGAYYQPTFNCNIQLQKVNNSVPPTTQQQSNIPSQLTISSTQPQNKPNEKQAVQLQNLDQALPISQSPLIPQTKPIENNPILQKSQSYQPQKSQEIKKENKPVLEKLNLPKKSNSSLQTQESLSKSLLNNLIVNQLFKSSESFDICKIQQDLKRLQYYEWNLDSQQRQFQNIKSVRNTDASGERQLDFYPAGLINDQNDNRFNCLLQILFRNPVFIREVLSLNQFETDQFSYQMNLAIANLILKTQSFVNVSDLLKSIEIKMATKLQIKGKDFESLSTQHFFENLLILINETGQKNIMKYQKGQRFFNQKLSDQYQLGRLSESLVYSQYIEVERSDQLLYISLLKDLQKGPRYSVLPKSLLFSIKKSENNENCEYWFPLKVNLEILISADVDKEKPIQKYLEESAAQVSKIYETFENLKAMKLVQEIYESEELIYQDVVDCLQRERETLQSELNNLYPKNMDTIKQNKNSSNIYYLQIIVTQEENEDSKNLYSIYIFNFFEKKWQRFKDDQVIYITFEQVSQVSYKNACILIYVNKEQYQLTKDYESNLKAIILQMSDEQFDLKKMEKNPFLQYKVFQEIFQNYQ